MARVTRYTPSPKTQLTKPKIDTFNCKECLAINYKSPHPCDKCNNKSIPRVTRYTIQNTPKSVPVNTIPVIETIPEEIKKDCGWFGEKCAFDGIVKGFEESGKGLDIFVKEEQKKQEDSWKWFNDGTRETQEGISNFFENEGIKQKETIQSIQQSIEDTGKGVVIFFENEGIKQEESWKTLDDSIKDIQSGIVSTTDGIIQNVDDTVLSTQGWFEDVSKGAVEVGKGFGDFNKNIMAIGIIGVGAVVFMGMRK